MRLALGASVPWQDGVTVAEDTTMPGAAVRAWNEGDLEAFLACFREDVVVEGLTGTCSRWAAALPNDLRTAPRRPA